MSAQSMGLISASVECRLVFAPSPISADIEPWWPKSCRIHNFAAKSATFAIVFILRAVPILAAGILNLESRIPAP